MRRTYDTRLAYSSERVCEATGKQRMRQREAAELQWERRGAGIYLCKHCGGWHLTGSVLQDLGTLPGGA